MLTLDQARALGGAWFGSYLDADWQPRTAEASQAVLESVGLTGSFWQLQ